MSRYSVNHNFFQIPNNINCYWAGILAADGNISNNRVRLYLHQKDCQHIQNFISALESNYKLYTYRTACGVEMSSSQMVTNLYTVYNITPKKSLTLLPPNLTNEDHIRSFIRGYMDGDGCISVQQKRCYVGFCGTQNMMKWIKNSIQKYVLGTGDISIHPNHNIFEIKFTGFQCVAILNWLYKDTDSQQRLARKYDMFLLLKESIKQPNKTSIHKRIYFCKRDKRWIVYLKDPITHIKRQKSFETEHEALMARGNFYD